MLCQGPLRPPHLTWGRQTLPAAGAARDNPRHSRLPDSAHPSRVAHGARGHPVRCRKRARGEEEGPHPGTPSTARCAGAHAVPGARVRGPRTQGGAEG